MNITEPSIEKLQGCYQHYHYSPRNQQLIQQNTLKRTVSTNHLQRNSSNLLNLPGNHLKLLSFPSGNNIKISSRETHILSSRPSSPQINTNGEAYKDYLIKKNSLLNNSYTKQQQSNMVKIQTINKYNTEYIERLVNQYGQQYHIDLLRCQTAHNLELQKLGQVIKENQIKIQMQQKKIHQLNDRAIRDNIKYEGQILKFKKIIISFEKYHEQCYQYTFSRITDIQNKLYQFTNNIEKMTQNKSTIQIVQRLKNCSSCLVQHSFQENIKFRLNSLEKIQQIIDETKKIQEKIQYFRSQLFLEKSKNIQSENIKQHLIFLRSEIKRLEGESNFKQVDFIKKIESLKIIENQKKLKDTIKSVSQKILMMEDKYKQFQSCQQKFKRQIAQLQKENSELKQYKINIQRKIAEELQIFERQKYQLRHQCQTTINKALKQNQILKEQISQMARQYKEIKQQIDQLSIINSKLQEENNNLTIKNQQNTKFMNHYVSAFEQKCQIFQVNIKKLQKQIQTLQNQKQLTLQKSKYTEYYRQYIHQNFLRTHENKNPYQKNTCFQSIRLSPSRYQQTLTTNSLNSTQRTSIIERLKNVFQFNKIQIPVKCQIDETGYLKNAQLGTYIIDEDGNMFCLTEEQKNIALNKNIIKIE